MTQDFGGVINDLVAGRWKDPLTGQRVTINIRSIVIKETIDGLEAELIKPLHGNEKLGLVSDKFTYEVLGRRVAAALKSGGLAVEEYIWDNPRSTIEGVEELREITRPCDGLIAVGAGTINDSVKYATFLDKKKYSVFPTSPQNAYTTPTASISFGGFKKSLTTHPAQGVFFDLSAIAQCPIRLTQSAFADVICRTTAQVDWLMSHLLFKTEYQNLPYVLLAFDEDALIDGARRLKNGEVEAFGVLIRICALMGLGTNFASTTHSGSMGEHMISHYIDMFAGRLHPGTLHGEQVGAATLTMSRLQNMILNKEQPPRLDPTSIDEAAIMDRYGPEVGRHCLEQLKRKALDRGKTDRLNRKLSREWNTIAGQLREVMLPFERLHVAMTEIGAPRNGRELGLPSEFYRQAVRYARDIRDRFTMLDLADDAGILDGFVADCE